jgi:hypothetical protein
MRQEICELLQEVWLDLRTGGKVQKEDKTAEQQSRGGQQ